MSVKLGYTILSVKFFFCMVIEMEFITLYRIGRLNHRDVS